MKRTTMMIVCLVTMLTATAQEQIESPIISEKDSTYYVNQEQLWHQVTQEQPSNGTAWRNLYQAANYQQWFGPRNDMKLQQILNDMSKAIPQDYNYFWCMYKFKVGSNESFEWAEKALKCLPEEMIFSDYDMWTGYLMMRFDERRLDDLCKRYYQSGLYSPGVLQYNYNELQGMDEGGIYFGNGDACLIPKAILQYGKGLHKDKLVVCMSFLAIPDYREKLLSRLGIDTIYVTREVMVPQTPDTIIRYVERPKIKKEVRDVKVVKPSVATTENNMDFTGRSIDQDNIDYTMLVMK